MMKRVLLVNRAGVKLGEVSVPADCGIVEYGGGHFVASGEPVLTLGQPVVWKQTMRFCTNKADPVS